MFPNNKIAAITDQISFITYFLKSNATNEKFS